MAIGLVGRKCGMTRIFTEAGISVPVTVIEVDPNRITQIKTLETLNEITFNQRFSGLISLCFKMRNDFIPPTVNGKYKTIHIYQIVLKFKT